jgi:hypothetical protein
LVLWKIKVVDIVCIAAAFPAKPLLEDGSSLDGAGALVRAVGRFDARADNVVSDVYEMKDVSSMFDRTAILIGELPHEE